MPWISSSRGAILPIGRIAPREEEIHGIGARETSGAAPFSSESSLFMDLRETGPFCAHNAVFESALVRSVWPVPRLVPDFLTGKPTSNWGPWMDTLRIYEMVFPQLSEHNLSTLVGLFGLQAELDSLAAQHCPATRRRYHSALYDAIACALLVANLGRLPGYEGLTTEWLLIQSSGSDAAQTELF